MLILELALAALLTTKESTPRQPESPPYLQPSSVVLAGPELAHAIKKDIEAIAGPGTVEVSIDHDTLYSVRVAVPSFRADIYKPIYDRAIDLYRRFPDLSFDFYLRPRSISIELPRR
jgi:hypothetical protein